jgi:hypothetical protein
VGDESYEAVQIGEIVQAEIKKSRFQVNDPYILSVGYFRGLSSKGVPKVVAIPEAAEEAAEEVAEEVAEETQEGGTHEEEEEDEDEDEDEEEEEDDEYIDEENA